MKQRILFVVLAAIALAGCVPEKQAETKEQTGVVMDTITVVDSVTVVDTITAGEWPFKGIPFGATLMDCTRYKLLFHEKNGDIEQLWIYELETQKTRVFLTCHHHYGPTCYSGRNGYAWPRDSICNICSAEFVEYQENVIVVGEACTTYAIYYVVSDSDALYLTGGTKYLGELYENGWYAIEERSYEEEYDPYSIVSYYNDKGKLMRTDKCRRGGKRHKTAEL